MTLRELMVQVVEEVGFPDGALQIMRDSVRFAETLHPEEMSIARRELTQEEVDRYRQMIRILLFKALTDPEYRKQLNKDRADVFKKN